MIGKRSQCVGVASLVKNWEVRCENIDVVGVASLWVRSLDPLFRWFSTNTRTLDFPETKSETAAGMSYRGQKSTTFNGIECLPWGEVFSRCTKGFEKQSIKALRKEQGEDYVQLEISSYLSQMSPDRLGLRSRMTPSGLFDSDSDMTRGHNECRMPALREAWLKSYIQSQSFHQDHVASYFPFELAKSGPFCFVDASDPRAMNFTSTTG